MECLREKISTRQKKQITGVGASRFVRSGVMSFVMLSGLLAVMITMTTASRVNGTPANAFGTAIMNHYVTEADQGSSLLNATGMVERMAMMPATGGVARPDTEDLLADAENRPPGWDFSWELALNGSQASYSNWAQGGSNNIAVTGSSLYKSTYTEGKFIFDSSLNTRFGQAKIDGDGVRKTDDKFEFRNRLSYLLNHGDAELKVFGSLNFRTQFDRGFEYDKGPDGGDLYISNFMAPGYLTENLGLALEPAENLSLEAGMALQQTFIRDEELRERYKFAPDESVRNEGGIILAATYAFRLAENMSVNSSLETFTSLDKSLTSTDFVFKNQITGKINSFMNAGLRLDVAYDDDFSDELQVAQVLTLGISLAFFEE